ncbi:amidohydrolase [Alkalihalobacillus sp. BA299]|uniref:amidohydrolase n=1 Tax=Alkalihalobacillus sp. BA299 TaxID=2815938 RepID=UPI001ADB0049|nr:amidohydrolase [Alkalihalobacillus sp. BA299]
MATLWYGGTFYTMKKEGEQVEAVLTDRGKIKALGTMNELESQFESEITKRVNIDGGFAYPGFVDSHLHMIGHGERLLRLDLSEVQSADRMKELLMEKVNEADEGEWVIGEGWNENNFSDRKIFHYTELDEIAPNHPMLLKRICRHALLANSKAMELANITKETVDPQGGVIVRDTNGQPTGYLLDEAQELIKQVVPEESADYLHKALTKSIDDMLRLGLVGGHTEDLSYYGSPERPLRAFNQVIDGQTRKFRAHLLVHHQVAKTVQHQFEASFKNHPYIELGAIKIFADGALGGRTALLSSPYNDAPDTNGVAIHSEEDLLEIVKLARTMKKPVAIHTIGDLAVEYALNAIEKYPLIGELPDRLIHVQVLRSELIDRLKKLPVILDIQPSFIASDFPWVEERLGYDRLSLSFAWKTLLNEGLVCAGGSDAPIESVDPLLGIHAAVTRRKVSEDHIGYLPEQKLSMFEAIKLYTSGSAAAINAQDRLGLIDKGFMADFTIFEKDLFQLDGNAIIEANPIMTVVDETVMYSQSEVDTRK